MKDKRHQLGRDSEQLAALYLQEHGYEIIQHNFRTRFGEIDIIARENKTIVFIEVKSRTSANYGYAVQALTRKQQLRLSKTALTYLHQNHLKNQSARFDVVAIQKDPQSGIDIRLIKNAFEFYL
ncbi:MAG: YraN family protein [Candidatus Magnetomorum sp.]|nr:YraN family protein [Candidatus Magnetomorum sp.]